MAILCQIARMFAKFPAQIHPKDFKLEFTFGGTEEDKKLAAKLNKGRWGAAVGLKADDINGQR